MPKIWFVTGSSRGFGRRFAEAALARGDKVADTARATPMRWPTRSPPTATTSCRYPWTSRTGPP